MTFGPLLEQAPYALPQADKERWLTAHLNQLTRAHLAGCAEYRRLLSVLEPERAGNASCLAEVPYLSIGLFKSHRLQSVPDAEVFKTMTSSGTTGQTVSQVVLDRETARLQTIALASIMTHALGPQRLPMLIVDSPDVLRDRKRFSARGAGILGMMSFGRQHCYLLNEQMQLDRQQLHAFLARHAADRILIFGFTFMVWQYLYQVLADGEVDLSRATLVHSGGWKKLTEQQVDRDEFKRRLRQRTGLAHIHDFYGMVEQVGSVYLEAEDGFLYPPSFADVIVRDSTTWREARLGEPGVFEVLSALPQSYPGHAILTEDLGVVHGIDDSSCGRLGKRFSVLGRVPRTELRGCGDTHAYRRAI
jgi:hypothetical protein